MITSGTRFHFCDPVPCQWDCTWLVESTSPTTQAVKPRRIDRPPGIFSPWKSVVTVLTGLVEVAGELQWGDT